MAYFCGCPRRRRNNVTVRNFEQNNFIPSAVEVLYGATQTVANGEEITFLQTNYNTGVSFSPRLDNLGVDIVASGVYKITFQGIIDTEADGVVSLGLSLNGTLLPQSEILQYVTTAGPETVTTGALWRGEMEDQCSHAQQR